MAMVITTECDPGEFAVVVGDSIIFCHVNSDSARDRDEVVEALQGLERQATCEHDWQEQPGEPPVDVCPACGAIRE